MAEPYNWTRRRDNGNTEAKDESARLKFWCAARSEDCQTVDEAADNNYRSTNEHAWSTSERIDAWANEGQRAETADLVNDRSERLPRS